MKSFKQFILEALKPKDLRLQYIHNTHGFHANKPKEEYIFNTHGSHAKKLKESEEQHPSFEEHYLGYDKNKTASENLQKLKNDSKAKIEELHKSHPLDEDALEHTDNYTNESSDVTDSLLNAHRHSIIHDDDSKYNHPSYVKHTIEGLDNHAFTPAKHDLETHSGVKYNIHDYRPVGTSKQGHPVYEHPTYMSSSTNKNVAHAFSIGSGPSDYEDESHEGDSNGHYHIFNWHIKKGQPISVIGDHSVHADENEDEVLIHRGNVYPRHKTYLEHRGQKTYTDNKGRTIHVHNIGIIPESEVNKTK